MEFRAVRFEHASVAPAITGYSDHGLFGSNVNFRIADHPYMDLLSDVLSLLKVLSQMAGGFDVGGRSDHINHRSLWRIHLAFIQSVQRHEDSP